MAESSETLEIACETVCTLESSIRVWALLRHVFHMSSPLTQACLQAGSRHISWRARVLEEEKDEMYVLIQPQRHV